MAKNENTYNEKFKQNQKKLKDRAEELLSNPPIEEEPQSVGDPSKVFEEDKTEGNDK